MCSPVQNHAIALLERAEECERIAMAPQAARAGAGSLTLIEDPVGTGKTKLLFVARRTAAGAGMVVTWARGSKLERERASGSFVRCSKLPSGHGPSRCSRAVLGLSGSCIAAL